jgi:hypothetical protein
MFLTQVPVRYSDPEESNWPSSELDIRLMSRTKLVRKFIVSAREAFRISFNLRSDLVVVPYLNPDHADTSHTPIWGE